jgi:hypothetical protein
LIERGEHHLDIEWDRDVATVAIRLYAKDLVAQMRLPEEDVAARDVAYSKVQARMAAEVDEQIAERGYYVPFGPVRMIICRKEKNLL